MMRRIGFGGICVVTAFAVSSCGGPPPAALRGLGGETELTFVAKETKYIVIENAGNAAGELGESFIEEGGVRKAETIFKVTNGTETTEIKPCKFPTPGQELERKGDKCDIGVELVKETKATATFVVEYGGLHGNQKEGKATIPVKF